jgi:RHS repeat-associated protein
MNRFSEFRSSERSRQLLQSFTLLRYGTLPFLLSMAAFGQCTFTVGSGANAYVDARGAVDLAGDPLVIQITASAQTCVWTADATDGFATVTGPTSGTGNGSVTYSIPANPSPTVARTTTLNVGGNAITLKQNATVTTFQDVLPNDPRERFYFDGINFLAQKKIAAGTSTNPPLYSPAQNVTRGQMAVFIIATIYNGSSGFTYSTTPYFTDVLPSNPFFKFIQKMRDLGIAAGETATTYGPNDPVTRAQMAVFITLARLGPQTPFTYGATQQFGDVPPSNPFFKFVQKLAEMGITAGCTAATSTTLANYCPNNVVTRDQMAVFLIVGGFNLLEPSAPAITSVSPNFASPGTSVPVTITGINTHFDSTTTILPTSGITASAPTNITNTQIQTTLTIPAGTPLGQISLTAETPDANAGAGEEATLPNGFTIGTGDPVPTITSFTPASGPIGTAVTVTGTALVSSQGIPATVLVPLQGGGTTSAPVTSATGVTLTFVIPSTGATGNFTISSSSGSVKSATPFTVVPSSTYTISAAPSTANVIAGQSTTYTITASSSNAFTGLASLSLAGLPGGLTAAFNPPQITAGQQSTLTIIAPANQATNTATLTINASATVDGLPVPAAATATLNITPISTSFLGRTVVDNTANTPLAGVVVSMVGQDGAGNMTGCTGSTTSDGSGNFALTNLPPSCLGPQLIGFNGNTVTSPAGTYAGLQLVFTLVSNTVVVSPVLVHLPRVDNVETFMVTQNAATDQSYTFKTIPGLSVTVYAGTTFTEQDGSQPNPFPLAAIEVPVDRLPDVMPSTTASITAFIVAFQPAETNASQAVAVWFPNTLNTPPGTDVPLMTLDPTRGRMVPYGTGTVSNDGTTIIPDIDPSTGDLQHRYGIVHFDWHGPAGGPPNDNNPGPPCGGSAGDPVDFSSGLFSENNVDIELRGLFPIRFTRTLRNGAVAGTFSSPFGLGGDHNYDYRLDLVQTSDAPVLNLIMPDGNRYPFNRQADGTLVNTSICALSGAVMTTAADNTASIKLLDGSIMSFFPGIVPTGSLLSAWTDKNNNTLTFTRDSGPPYLLQTLTNGSGRSLNFTYDGSYRIVQLTDNIGRTVSYTYNDAGSLASATLADGATWKYGYDANGNINSVTDPRGIVTAQNTYDANSRVTQQTAADGSAIQLAYTLINPLVPTSPVQQTVVTDQNGNSATYRFNPLGYPLSVTDAMGNERDFSRASGTNLLLSATGNGQCGVLCGDPRQGNLSYTYDSYGNILTITSGAGGVETFTYLTGTNLVTSFTNPLGKTWVFAYDSKGNLTSLTDPAGGVKAFSWAGNGTLTQSTDELGDVTSYQYDTSGNLTASTDPDGNVTQWSYDAVGRPLAKKDPKGQITLVAYDARDRVIKNTNPAGQTVTFSYDPLGNIKTATDPKGGVTTYAYNVNGLLSSVKDADGNTTTYTYDSVGNLLSTTDRRGLTTTYTYDALNHRVSETFADGATVIRQFDAAGRVTLENDSVAGVFQYQYDAVGNLAKKTTPFGSVSYSRDAASDVTSRQVTGQPATNYTFDPRGYVSSMAIDGNKVQFTYDARGAITGVARSNGVNTTYTYDPAGNRLSIVHANGGTTLDGETIAWDPLSNVAGINRILGQVLATQAANATYDAANRLISFGTRTITSDNNGNRLTDSSSAGATSYTWDARNRLVAMTVPASGNTPALTVAYTYDPQGNLIRRRATGSSPDLPGGDVVTQYLQDENSNVIYQETVGGEQLNMLTGFNYDQQYGVVGSAGTIGFALHDHLGSIIGNTDQTGTLVGQNDYEPFGQTTQLGTGSSPFAFQGRIQTVSNLYNFRARYYDPTTGSFISEDPAGISSDFNLYRFAGNNPANQRDPTGRLVSMAPVPTQPQPPGATCDISNANTIATQMQSDDQKQQMQRWQIQQDAQNKIFQIQQDVTNNKTNSQDKAYKTWDAYVRN